MPHIIQDSDDSDTEDLHVHQALNTVSSLVNHDLLSTLRTASASSSPYGSVIAVNKSHDMVSSLHMTPLGTRSTDSSSDKAMRRQLEKAHSALFEATPVGEEAKFGNDDTKRKLKRTKTASVVEDFAEVSREGEKIKRRKTAHTYGVHGSKGGFGELWDVPSSARDQEVTGLGFLTHNPNEMFPDSTGSIESRGPKTQTLVVESSRESHQSPKPITSQVIDKVQIVDSMLGPDIQITPLTSRNGEETSFNWGDGNHDSGLVDVSNKMVHADLQEREETILSTDHFKAQEIVVKISKTQVHDVEAEYLVKEEEKKTKINKYTIADEDDTEEEATHAVKPAISSTESAGVLENSQAISEKDNDNPPARKLRTSLPNTNHSNDAGIHEQTRKKKSVITESTIEEIDDELSLELPKDLYKPRPSKSRGGERSVEVKLVNMTDPPKAAKSKLRRHKTTGAISAYSSSLREMGFRSSQVEVALADANGNFDEALETLTNRNNTLFGDDAKRSPTKTSRSEMPVIVEKEEPKDEDTTEENLEEEKDYAELPRKDTRKNIKAGKRGRGRPKKKEIVAEVDESEQEIPEEVNSTDEDSLIPVIIEPRKRKSRGRPKKGMKLLEESVQNDVADIHGDEKQSHNSVRDIAPLQDRNLNKPGKGAAPQEKQNEDEDEQENEPKATPPNISHGPDVDPANKTPENNAPSGPPKLHSPLKIARVPLKVGLSKRAKIEPLLRIVRK